MAVTETLLDIVPSVRRFARALIGNQRTGDEVIKLALRSLSSEQQLPEQSLHLRILLFKKFLECYSSLNSNASRRDGNLRTSIGGAEGIISAIELKPRQAFLLHTMEGFSSQSCALIMQVSQGEFSRLFAAAQLSIGAQTATDVLIIEDEVLIAHDLQRIVERLGHRVIGRARTRSDVPLVLNRRIPGLILADIRLSDDSSGIDAVNDILIEHAVPVVFITSFPEELVTGARPDSASLLSKPFQVESVCACINQALLFEMRAKFVSEPSALEGKPVVSGSAVLKRVILRH